MMPTPIQRQIEKIVTNGILYRATSKEYDSLKTISEKYEIPEFDLSLVRLSLSRMEAFQALQYRDNIKYREIKRFTESLKEQMKAIILVHQELNQGDKNAS